jgi:hypothetical protein
MMHFTILLEDVTIIANGSAEATRAGVEVDNPIGSRDWRIWVQDNRTGKGQEAVVSNIEFGYLLFLAVGAGEDLVKRNEEGDARSIDALVVAEAYRIVEPIIQGWGDARPIP